jgi:hypothetical protein
MNLQSRKTFNILHKKQMKKRSIIILFILICLAGCKENEWAPAILAQTAQSDTASFIKVSNQDSITITNIEIKLNDLYTGKLEKLDKGEEKLIPVSEFKDAEGKNLDSKTHVTKIEIHAEGPHGESGGIQFGG